MVIGSGLVAKGFSAYENDNRFLIFASGVSNSASTNSDVFAREKTLLQKTLKENKDKIFVYFGTCSVYDVSLAQSAYVIHKLEMEDLVKQHEEFYIFRISNLAGNTNNRHTVLNFFYYHIIEQTHFSIWKKAYRNIIDLDDAVLLCNYILQKRLFRNEITNIANSFNYAVSNIVETLEHICGKKGNYDIADKGGDPFIDTSKIEPLFSILNIEFDETYLMRTLKKYYS